LYLAVLASAFGGCLGVLALIAGAPALARVALKFGPPEYFLVGLMGLTVVGSLTGKNALKGLISVCFGLILGMIGFDTVSGGNRLHYGSDIMVMGIELLSVVLGLFAVSEMLDQLVKIYKKKSTKLNQADAIRDLGKISVAGAVKIMLKSKFLLIKSSLIGAFLGILPGPGGAISAFIAYGEAKRGYPKESFGTGNPRGIVAAESANNGAVGGAMIPMLALGIPGSPTAAIMYGAMVIHGLQAGPRLFVDNANFAYTFSWGMLLTVIVMGLVGVLCVPLFSKILKIDTRYIIITVIMCSLLGAFSIRNSMFDVFVTIAIGFLGYYLNKYGVPTAPIVLGLILSKLIERNFRLSLTIAAAEEKSLFTYIFSRPLCIGILILGIVLIILNIRTMVIENRMKNEKS
jgi:putative tricarboxylic transport membrane protein